MIGFLMHCMKDAEGPYQFIISPRSQWDKVEINVTNPQRSSVDKGALVWEGMTFPSDVAQEAIKQVVKLPGKTGADVRADAIHAAKQFLARRYPPGGVIGYWRWAMAEKTIAIPITGAANPKPIVYHSNGGMFIVRVLLCGLAFTLAIYSQVGRMSRRNGKQPDHGAEAI